MAIVLAPWTNEGVLCIAPRRSSVMKDWREQRRIVDRGWGHEILECHSRIRSLYCTV
jgi:hypothetical protein